MAKDDSTAASTVKKNKKILTIDEDNNLPALNASSSSEFESKLTKIEDQLYSIAERQKTGVSPEFSALMDGYVNKANESQEYKVKFEHLEKLHDDLRIEYKTLHEDNKKFKAELEASRDALRQSETDLQRHRKETENTRMHNDEQVASLVDERERLKTKVKQLMDHKEKTAQEYNDLKAELLEHKYKAKQLEQEKQVEIESARRSVRESNKIIEELKEKLDLRTREVEYKDALLNQLIKQVSAEETYSNSDSVASNYASSNAYASNYDRPVERPASSVKIDEGGEGASWGAFRK